jgi:two-component system sensor histidine kinase YesM
MLSITAIILETIAVSSFFSRRIAKSDIYDYVTSAQKQAVTSIELQMDELIMLSIRLRTSRELYSAVSANTQDEEDKRRRVQSVMESILSWSNQTVIGGISLVSSSGNVYFCLQDGVKLAPPPQEMLERIEKTSFYVCGDMLKDQFGNSYIPVGLACKAFYTNRNLGALILYLKEKSLLEIYENMLPDMGYSFILNYDMKSLSLSDEKRFSEAAEKVKLIASSEEVFAGVELINQEESVLAIHKLSQRMHAIGFRFLIASVVPYKKIFSVEEQIETTLIFLGIVMAATAMLTALTLAKRLTAPFRKLATKLKELSFGKLDLIGDPKDEIWELENSYNDMVVRINDLMEKNIQEKENERQMEFIALQAQINPHFLYNTLDAVGWIARLKHQDEIEMLVMELSKFFRLSLHKGDHLITIDDEAQLAKSFIAIEQLRNPGKFDFEFFIDDDLRDILVPKIILQPVVENALKHGLYQKRSKGRLNIRIYRTEDDIFMEVTDDGAGFDKNKLENKEKETASRNGYGLKNVDERLRLEYGSSYGLEIESELGVGTKVVLKLRIREEEKKL